MSAAGAGAAAADCLSLAIAFHQAPGRFPELLRGHAPLPPGMTLLLRIAGGAFIEDDVAVALPPVSSEEVRQAARFFIDQVLLAFDADHYRVLGVDRDAPPEQIREHHRLLMRIFHPDRARHAEDATDRVAARINLAYDALREPGERAAYDKRLGEAPKAAEAPQRSAHWVRPERPPGMPGLPPGLARHLPQFVLAGFALLASTAVGLVYLSHEPAGAIGSGNGDSERRPVAQGAQPVETAMLAPAVRTAQVAAQELAPDPAMPSLRFDGMSSFGGFQEKKTEPSPAQEARSAVALAEPGARRLSPVTARLDQAISLPPAAPASTGSRQDVPAAAPAQQVAVMQPPVAQPPARQPTSLQPPASQPPAPQPPEPEPAPQPAAAPSPAPATAAVTPPRSTTPVARDELVLLVAQLSARYERGDIESFLALFDDTARIEGGGKARIRSDYEDLFRSTQVRQLQIWDVTWVPDGEVFRGEGSFQAKVVRRGEDSVRTYNGTIRLEAVAANGTARLRGLFH